ncbi:MAG: single-stranded DNA-binding protein [Thermoplasmata archaeon]
MEEKNPVKVDELTPASKNADVTVKVLNLGERKTIDSKFGGSRDLVEATVGDETATVILTLWGDQIDGVAKDDVIDIDNGYVSLVRGHMRLNVGKYGSFKKSDEEIPEVNTSVDRSADEYESDRRPPRGGSYGGGGRGRGNQQRRSRGRRRY